MARCPYCNLNFRHKAECVSHIEKRHPEALVDTGLNAEQLLYQSTHGTIHGKCMCGCGRDTEWNYKTGKPFKLSPEPSCKKRIAAIADARNMKVYGKAKVIDDPALQEKMLKNRKIAGKYKFTDGGQVSYVGKLELNFLQFCDKILELQSRMVLDTPEVFNYYDPKTNKDRFYMPDYYLPDYNLIIEIKPGGEHPNTNPAYIEETRYKEDLKDDAMKKQTKYNFLKVVDKNYGPLVETLFAITHGTKLDVSDWNGSVAVLQEAAMNPEYNEVVINETFSDLFVIIGRDSVTGREKISAVSESSILSKMYACTRTGAKEIYLDDPIFENCEIEVYRFIGSNNALNGVLTEAVTTAMLTETVSPVDKFGALTLLDKSGIRYNFGNQITNTNTRMNEFVKIATIGR